MTVTYSLDVAKSRFLGFTKLLVRWKGSIYKILWREMVVFCICYALLSVIYRCCLKGEQKRIFENVVIFVDAFTDFIPLSFVLGFYVTLVIGRWWAQYEAIPWPDRLCYMISAYVHGADERSRMIRRTLGRYLILVQALTFQAVSTAVKKRFPTLEHLVVAGIMTKEEHMVYEKIPCVYGKWWLPCYWFTTLVSRGKKEGRIKDSVLHNELNKELIVYRTACGTMLGYDWISVPLVYTQVVTLATYLYSLALIVGRQYLDPTKGYEKHEADLYIPLFTLAQFFFYVGWLKVAEQILNPYGEDDDDFELNWCLDRAVYVVYLLVDQQHMKHPKVCRDAFWDDLEPSLPQTRITAKYILNPQLGSAHDLEVEDVKYLPIDTFLEQDREENIYCGDSVRKRNDDSLRSSFVARVWNSRFAQSFRRKPSRRVETLRSLSQPGGSVKSTFSYSNNKNFSNRSTPAVSRKSSMNKMTTPSPSRASSISVRRQRKYDLQKAEKADSFSDKSVAVANLPATGTSSFPILDDLGGNIVRENADADTQILDSVMPSIPEESSRCTSLASIDAGGVVNKSNTTSQRDDLKKVVAEANMVLKELTKTISNQGGYPGVKGYESCCSLSSDESSCEESDNEGENNEGTYVIIEDSKCINDEAQENIFYPI